MVNSASPVVQSWVCIALHSLLQRWMQQLHLHLHHLTNQDTLLGQLNRYLADLAGDAATMKTSALEYWAQHQYIQPAEARCWGFDERASIAGLCWEDLLSLRLANSRAPQSHAPFNGNACVLKVEQKPVIDVSNCCRSWFYLINK